MVCQAVLSTGATIVNLNRHSPCFLRDYDFSEGDKESKNKPKECIITN